MSRFRTEPALVVKIRQTGESNREATFLTASSGLLRATVYGGAKSKLRAFVSIFHSGTLYLYHNPVRDSYKVSDFDAESCRIGIREQYERSMAGAAILETVLAGFGGGADWREAYILTNATLDALENAQAQAVRRIFTYFLWKWIDILGACPDIGALELPRRYPGALDWLRRTERALPSNLAALSLDDAPLLHAKSLCLEILTHAYGRKLSSWMLVS